MTVVVDPYLLAIPSGDDITSDAVREYVGRLTNWDKAFRVDSDYVVSSVVMGRMYSLKLTPDYHNLQILFEQYDIYEFSAFDVSESCKTVIENYPQMEEKAAAEGIECKKEDQRIIPEQIRARLHPSIADAFSDALISTSYALDLLGDEDVWILATAPIIDEDCSAIVASGKIKDNAVIVLVERQWPLLFKPSEYVDSIATQEKILSVYEKNPEEALKISWMKIKKKDPRMAEISQYKICFKKEFIESIKEKNIKQRPHYRKDLERIFDGISNSLTNRWQFGSDKHHALRKSIQQRTSDQQIRKRGNLTDRAGRIEIIGGSTPLHVHYWQCEDGTNEISNVTDDHDDPTIYA